jgi:hypothetical protein
VSDQTTESSPFNEHEMLTHIMRLGIDLQGFDYRDLTFEHDPIDNATAPVVQRKDRHDA